MVQKSSSWSSLDLFGLFENERSIGCFHAAGLKPTDLLCVSATLLVPLDRPVLPHSLLNQSENNVSNIHISAPFRNPPAISAPMLLGEATWLSHSKIRRLCLTSSNTPRTRTTHKSLSYPTENHRINNGPVLLLRNHYRLVFGDEARSDEGWSSCKFEG